MRIRPLVVIVALTSSMSLVGVEARANPQYFSDTGHYYEVVQERLDWDAAQLAAASQNKT